MKKFITFILFGICVVGFIAGCASKGSVLPQDSVDPFVIKKFAGKWYEIARMPNEHEKNLKNVEAFYTIDKDDKFSVYNRAQDINTGQTISSNAVLRYSISKYLGAMQITYDWLKKPYNIVKIDDDYNYAMIFGDTNNMWIISRKKTIPAVIKAVYLGYAKEKGYKTQDLIYTVQE